VVSNIYLLISWNIYSIDITNKLCDTIGSTDTSTFGNCAQLVFHYVFSFWFRFSDGSSAYISYVVLTKDYRNLCSSSQSATNVFLISFLSLNTCSSITLFPMMAMLRSTIWTKHYYKMRVQFTIPCSLNQWIHYLFASPCSFKIQWNHLAYEDTFCCSERIYNLGLYHNLFICNLHSFVLKHILHVTVLRTIYDLMSNVITNMTRIPHRSLYFDLLNGNFWNYRNIVFFSFTL